MFIAQELISSEMPASTEKFSPFVKQCFVTAGVCFNVLGVGCALGFPAVLLPQLRRPGAAFATSREMDSWITSVLAISMFFGSFMTPPVMGRLGRKAAHYAATLPVLAGWLAMLLATSAEALLAGRVLHGLGMGMTLPLRSALVAECASPRRRGGFLATIALAQGAGVLLVHLIGSILSFRTTAIISLSFSCISLLMTFYSPESPSWLATKGKYDRCRKNFIWLRGEEELPELEKILEASKHLEQQQRKKGLKEIQATVKRKEFHKPVLLMFAIYIMMNFAGPIIFATYSTEILHLILGPDINVSIWMVAFDFQRLFFNIGAVYVINKTKRRTMLFGSGALCAGSHLAQAGYVFAKNRRLLPFDSLWIPGALVSLQVLSFAVGMIPLPSVIAGEVFPLQHRSLAGSISLVASSGSIFVVLKTFPGLIATVGVQGAYVLYAGIITAGLLVAWLLLPETRGRTLQEIEETFKGEHSQNSRGKELEMLNNSGEQKMPA